MPIRHHHINPQEETMWTVTLSANGETHVEVCDTEDEARSFARQAKARGLKSGVTITARVRKAESLPVFEALMDSLLGGGS